MTDPHPGCTFCMGGTCVLEKSMRLAAIIHMFQLQPRPLSKHAVHHHHIEPVMYDSDSQARVSRKEMHEPPLAKQGSICLLHDAVEPHKHSQMADVIERVRKPVGTYG